MMDSISEFLHMGGYAFYVWTSYAIATLALGLCILIPWRHGKLQRQQLRRTLHNDGDPHATPGK